jgi:SSS family solute:Na+ symporter
LTSFKPILVINQNLNILDWVTFTLVLVLTLTSVIYGSKFIKKSDANDVSSTLKSAIEHLLMGRSLTLPLFIGTLVATWYGGIFGVTQIAFEKGIYNFITQGVFWYVSYIVFALFLVKGISQYQAITLPDMIGKMFGPKSAKLAAVFNLFNVLPIAYIISIGLFISSLSGLSLSFSMVIGLCLVLSYCLWGGLRSVVLSDLVQFFTMCLGVALVLALSFYHFGGPSFLIEKLPSSYFELTGGQGWGLTLVWGFIALSTLVDPNFYQRCFAAQSPTIAKRGILISTFIWFCFDICTTLGAMYAKAVIPESSSNTAYLTYAIQLLPHGLRGFFLASILATILSTLDSYLFLAATTLSFDLSKDKVGLTPKKHGAAMLVVSIAALGLAHVFSGDIKSVWKTLGSLSAGCMLLPVLLGQIYKNRVSDGTFLFSSLAGAFSMVVWSIIERPKSMVNVDGLYVGMITTTIIFFVCLKSKKTSF